ncbi:MAG: hypothetical protein KDH17_06790 [Rhodocyclaceae bacterium]|nr:hypothetical protein [Rhodocyclaceae bacterium]
MRPIDKSASKNIDRPSVSIGVNPSAHAAPLANAVATTVIRPKRVDSLLEFPMFSSSVNVFPGAGDLPETAFTPLPAAAGTGISTAGQTRPRRTRPARQRLGSPSFTHLSISEYAQVTIDAANFR